jgi:hypothetical protein
MKEGPYATCPRCREPLGPFEGETCVSCSGRRPSTIADRAVAVLETAPTALYIHDIGRGIEREFGVRVVRASLAASIPPDPRACWAGRGLYALVRHGYLAGARKLAGPGTAILHAVGDAMRFDALVFVMQRMGYRFTAPSLRNALSWDPLFVWYGSSRLSVPRGEAHRRLYSDGLGRTHRQVDAVVDDLRLHLVQHVEAYEKAFGRKAT